MYLFYIIGGLIIILKNASQLPAASIFLLGFSTTTGWYVYYEVILRHLLGDNSKIKDKILSIYKWAYPIPGMLLVVIAVTVGMPGSTLWLIGDFTSAVPTFVNVFTILILVRTFFKLLKDYKARYLGIGKIAPNFAIFYEEKKAQNK